MVNFLKSELSQFLTFARTEWQKVLTYRITVVVYRIAEMIETFILISMWMFIYASGAGLIKGYTMPEMITYVLIGGLCASVTRNFIWSSMARDIDKGDLSLFLVKPVSYIKYNLYSEVGGIIIVVFTSLVAQGTVIMFFLDKLIINTNIVTLALIFAMLLLSVFIELLLGTLVGIMAFWTDGEIAGFQKVTDVVRKFFAGGYFPLSLLPASFAFVGYYLPFAYSYFVPAQIYLGKMDTEMAIRGLGIQLVWIIILSCIVRIVWTRGLKKYEASGS